jgi:hypothetical protein
MKYYYMLSLFEDFMIKSMESVTSGIGLINSRLKHVEKSFDIVGEMLDTKN